MTACVHISKMGGGKRIDRVEDVLSLGDEIEVKVDDVDPNGKISLSPVGDSSPKASDGGGFDADAASSSSTSYSNGGTETSAAPAPQVDDADLVVVNFGDAYDATAAEKHGDLGPAVAGNFGGSGSGGGRDRGGRDRGGRDRRPRRR